MAKVFIEETTLTAIGDAIRAKEGTTDLIPVTDMSTRIGAIETGGGGSDITDEELTFTGNCNYQFYQGRWDWFVTKYADRIKTVDMTDVGQMFATSKLSSIPFQLNIKDCRDFVGTFQNCSNLIECPKIRGTVLFNTNTAFDSMLDGASFLRDINDLFTPEMLDGFSTVLCTAAYTAAKGCSLNGLRSLRTMPEWWYKFKLNPESAVFPYYNYVPKITNLYVLDEALNLPVWTCQAELKDNMFGGYPVAFEECNRLKNVTYETNEDGTPITAKWKNQTIDLSKYVGYVSSNSRSHITGYKSGIKEATRVTDDATYQALKDDPDWWTADVAYSRYNHDSAVATINSLPDCSATGTNTIKFKGTAGEKTDGGAINTLTEEEIAVATAKGWTVTFA